MWRWGRHVTCDKSWTGHVKCDTCWDGHVICDANWAVIWIMTNFDVFMWFVTRMWPFVLSTVRWTFTSTISQTAYYHSRVKARFMIKTRHRLWTLVKVRIKVTFYRSQDTILLEFACTDTKNVACNCVTHNFTIIKRHLLPYRKIMFLQIFPLWNKYSGKHRNAGTESIKLHFFEWIFCFKYRNGICKRQYRRRNTCSICNVKTCRRHRLSAPC